MQKPSRRAAAALAGLCLPAALASCVILVAGCNAVHFGGEEIACGSTPAIPGMAARPLDAGELRVVSWNLNGTPESGPMPGRIRRVATEILARGPDIALFQEVWFEGDALLLEHALADRYVRIRDAKAVGSHFLAPFTGFRRGGLLAFVSSAGRYRVEGGSRFEQFRDAAPWYRLRERDGIAGKGMQYFLLRDGTRRIALLNVHLQAQYAGANDGTLYRDVRAGQIDQLRSLAERLADNASVVIAAGDMNTSPRESDLYGRLTAYWTDLTRDTHQHCNCGTHVGKARADGSKPHGDRWIDYVLVRRAPPGVRPAHRQTALIPGTAPNCRYSDHHGLDVIFSLI